MRTRVTGAVGAGSGRRVRLLPGLDPLHVRPVPARWPAPSSAPAPPTNLFAHARTHLTAPRAGAVRIHSTDEEMEARSWREPVLQGEPRLPTVRHTAGKRLGPGAVTLLCATQGCETLKE